MDSLVAQEEGTAVNGLKLNDKSDGTGTNNSTSSTTHNHQYTACDRTNGVTSFPLIAAGYKGSSGTSNITGGSHTHNIYVISNDLETRPLNYTVRIWKRIS